jgi:glycosyltransferase involved in cell wall biosynthesis
MTDPRAVLLLPSLRTGGGTMQALEFAAAIDKAGCACKVWSMWQAPVPVPTSLRVTALSRWAPKASLAAFQLPWLAGVFVRARGASQHYVFTHYSTLPLAPFVPQQRRWLLVQDLEWYFMPEGWRRAFVRRVFLRAARYSRVVAANEYLAGALRRDGVIVTATYPIWADAAFAANVDANLQAQRRIDLLFVLRKGHAKQVGAYVECYGRLRARRPGANIVAVTPDEDLRDEARRHGIHVELRPSREALHHLYASSKCFALLSLHEGFALPPLEAMGAGCVPVCIDSGGPRLYMTGELSSLLVGAGEGAAGVATRVDALLSDPLRWRRLSECARTTFEAGLEWTRQQREQTVLKVAEAITRDAAL